MKNKMNIILIITFGLVLSACNDWITDTDPLIDNVEDEILNDAALMDFLILGVQGHLSEAVDNMFSDADLLSDQLTYSVPLGGTFSSYEDISGGNPPSDRTGAFNEIHTLRFFAEDLIRRAEENGVTRNDVKFVGNFHSAIAYEMLASYWALDENTLGSPVDGGPMVSQSDLYATAIEKYTASINFAATELEKRQAYSLIARCYLYLGNYGQARTAAANGLVAGDQPFSVLYEAGSNGNLYWSAFGPSRYQAAAADRFWAATTADPNEANRVQLKEVKDGETLLGIGQDKYSTEGSPIPYISWQENELMLAEIELREGGGDALSRINAVRASHSIDPLSSVDMDVLIAERDKELFLQGRRLIDQRRFNIWHLGGGTQQYFPIPEDERNANPNID